MLKPRKCFDVEISGPDGKSPDHWMRALQGSVLAVGPFPNTIAKQILTPSVWPEMPWLAKWDSVGCLSLPIDEGCLETWWEVYERIGKIVVVVVTMMWRFLVVAGWGCRSECLRSVLVALAFTWVGTRSCFGVYGQRHLHHHWFRIK
jgi:hypothetical protein